MNNNFANKNIIGSDETGVGDYLSPLVAAAVLVPKENINKLISLGVQDSKKLTDKKIIEIFENIKPYIKSSVRYVSQAKYNFLTDNKRFNAHELKLLIHLQAINAVESRIENYDLVIMDQFADLKNLNKYYSHISQSEEITMPRKELITLTNGESAHVAVAAASIVARAYFVKMMEEQEKKWNFKFPLGTNAIVENAAKEFVKANGKDALYQVAKMSFKTTEKII